MIEVFGWLAAAIGVAANLPQLLRILRAGTSAGVSLRLWQVGAASTASWCVHGYLVDAPQMQLPNLIMVLAALTIVYVVQRDRRRPILPALLLPLVVGAMLSGVNLLWGPLVFGLVVAVPQLYGQFAQLREMVQAPDLTGVSLGYLGVFLLVQAMWFTFGILTTDWALRVCAGAMVVVCVLNLTVYLVRRRRAVRPVTLVA